MRPVTRLMLSPISRSASCRVCSINDWKYQDDLELRERMFSDRYSGMVVSLVWPANVIHQYTTVNASLCISFNR